MDITMQLFIEKSTQVYLPFNLHINVFGADVKWTCSNGFGNFVLRFSYAVDRVFCNK